MPAGPAAPAAGGGLQRAFLSAGKRKGKGGERHTTRQDPWLKLTLAAAAWGRIATEAGIEVGANDVLDEFLVLAKQELWSMQREEHASAAEQERKEKLGAYLKELEGTGKENQRKRSEIEATKLQIRNTQTLFTTMAQHNPGFAKKYS